MEVAMGQIARQFRDFIILCHMNLAFAQPRIVGVLGRMAENA